MLVDNVIITVRAGNGGNGAATFAHTARTEFGGPDGGNGGNGGNIYFQGSPHVTDLRQFRYQKKIVAENGIPGKHFKLHGKNAPHSTTFVPIGTRIVDDDAGKAIEILDAVKPILVAAGGKGGRGNTEFKSSTNTTPRYAEKGTQGEVKKLQLDLRLIADIGLIGLPNAGKSSLLAALTNAKPIVADYLFTTLEPNIGMFGNHPIADIPGLIEGASQGKGLGITFLKHIEKTKLFVHCIDVTQADLIKSYHTVRNELQIYNSTLLLRPEIILLTKSDLVDTKIINVARLLLNKFNQKTLIYSKYDENSINKLKTQLKIFLKV